MKIGGHQAKTISKLPIYPRALDLCQRTQENRQKNIQKQKTLRLLNSDSNECKRLTSSPYLQRVLAHRNDFRWLRPDAPGYYNMYWAGRSLSTTTPVVSYTLVGPSQGGVHKIQNLIRDSLKDVLCILPTPFGLKNLGLLLECWPLIGIGRQRRNRRKVLPNSQVMTPPPPGLRTIHPGR